MGASVASVKSVASVASISGISNNYSVWAGGVFFVSSPFFTDFFLEDGPKNVFYFLVPVSAIF